jgi:ParB-like chromosome segregation protein Spo0J
MEMKLKELTIHKLASVTPPMSHSDFQAFKLDIDTNGQLEPVKVYRGAVIDGRHRYKALSELGKDTIKVTLLDDNLTESDLEVLVQSCEVRRHQSATQKAIYGWKRYNHYRQIGRKTSQGEIAKELGVARSNMAKVESLYKIAGEVIIEALFAGETLKIKSSTGKSYSTDSLNSILNYYQKINDEMIEDGKAPKELDDLTDEELLKIEKFYTQISAELSLREQEYLNTKIYNNYRHLKDALKTGRNNMLFKGKSIMNSCVNIKGLK